MVNFEILISDHATRILQKKKAFAFLFEGHRASQRHLGHQESDKRQLSHLFFLMALPLLYRHLPLGGILCEVEVN